MLTLYSIQFVSAMQFETPQKLFLISLGGALFSDKTNHIRSVVGCSHSFDGYYPCAQVCICSQLSLEIEFGLEDLAGITSQLEHVESLFKVRTSLF